MNIRPRLNKTEWVLFLTVFFAYAYFFQGRGGWGTTVRFDYVYSSVEKKSLNIDAYHGNTGDKAFFKGHYYLEKPIGSIFLAVPAYIFLKWIVALLNIHSVSFTPENTILDSLITMINVSLLSAIMAIFFYRLLGYFSTDNRKKILLVLSYSLGTIAFPYSTLFHGHQVCASLLFISFYLLFQMALKRKFNNGLLFISGFLAAFSVFAEYQTAIIYFGLSVYLLFRLDHKWKIVIFFSAAILPLARFMIFHSLCFSGPFDIGYRYCWFPLYFYFGKTGFMGITGFQWSRLYELTLSPYRGLFFYSPFLVFGLWGLYFLFRDKKFRSEGLLCGGIILAYIIVIASYKGWYGGWSFGPRYLIPMIPFLAFPAIFFLNHFRYESAMTIIFKSFVYYSFVLMLAGTAVNPESIPHVIKNPVFEFCFQSLCAGMMSFNLGWILLNWIPGLRNTWFFYPLTLLPLLIVLGLSFRYLTFYCIRR